MKYWVPRGPLVGVSFTLSSSDDTRYLEITTALPICHFYDSMRRLLFASRDMMCRAEAGSDLRRKRCRSFGKWPNCARLTSW